MENKLKKLKQDEDKIRTQVQKQVLGYITAAFGLIAGLAWNEAIKALIEELIPLGKNTLWAKLVYALIITIIVVIAGLYLAKLSKKQKEEEK